MSTADTFTPTQIPRLRTSRLWLREPRLGDFPDFAAERADAISAQYVGGAVDRVTAWRAFLAGPGSWLLHCAGWWAVEEIAAGKSIGEVGVFRREAPDLEIGWRIYRHSWRKGYASEAAAAALASAKERFAGERVIAYIAKDNIASIRVAEKIGMRRCGEVTFMGQLDWLYDA